MKEKKKTQIDLDIGASCLIYVPYWLGYFTGKSLEVSVVDATTGRVDLPIKESILHAFASETVPPFYKGNTPRQQLLEQICVDQERE